MNRAHVSAGELAYVDEGQGPVVVLLHGFPTSSLLWLNLIPLLAGRMRVIAPDMLGYGRSDRPADTDLSMVAQAGFVTELLAQLGIGEIAVVGHDLGGAVAQILALGGRVRVRTMVLLDAACFDVWPIEGVKVLQEATPEQQTAEFVESVVRLTFDLGVAHHQRLDRAVVDAYVDPWLEEPAAFFRAVGAIDGRGLAGREAELAAVEAPTMIIWGEEDPFLGPELAERLGDVLPWSTVALLPGCSHFVTEDAGPTVGQLVYEFLRLRYLEEQHSHAHAGGPVPVFLERPPAFEDLEDE